MACLIPCMKGVYILSRKSVYVSNITVNRVDRFSWIFAEKFNMRQGTICYIFVVNPFNSGSVFQSCVSVFDSMENLLNGYNYFSMMGIKLNHINKKVPMNCRSLPQGNVWLRMDDMPLGVNPLFPTHMRAQYYFPVIWANFLFYFLFVCILAFLTCYHRRDINCWQCIWLHMTSDDSSLTKLSFEHTINILWFWLCYFRS